ncbi:hypothetical protein GO495_18305 [Chitinophaga oryziterrae]|uniref:DUF3300 domain-containing protein n=1 Tax=Chitinophaga oryziterrae TaxID=1031224 RepID=A0A6N8JEJ9_9BACT|nr:hypothetical protein [Chitinophaga oryziterrae]MVT42552.1 hypothetical protein [Chitinophaga oryziterrae]
MKKLMFLVIALTGFTFASQAQVNVSINIGTQPAWGPTGYDYVDYYYLPDIESYYYVPGRVYIYRSGNTWHRSRTLPARYANFDVYNSHKVVINGVNRPYLQHDKYRQEYATYRGKHDQTPIRDSKEERYFVNRYHPQHAQWQKEHQGNDSHGNKGHGNNDHRNKGGKEKGHGKGKDRR